MRRRLPYEPQTDALYGAETEPVYAPEAEAVYEPQTGAVYEPQTDAVVSEAEQADAAGSYGGTAEPEIPGSYTEETDPDTFTLGADVQALLAEEAVAKDTAQPQAAEEPEDTDDAAGMEEPDTAALGADIQALMEEQKIQPEDEELPKAEKSGGKLAGGDTRRAELQKRKRQTTCFRRSRSRRRKDIRQLPGFPKSSGRFLHILCRLREWNSSCARRLREQRQDFRPVKRLPPGI